MKYLQKSSVVSLRCQYFRLFNHIRFLPLPPSILLITITMTLWWYLWLSLELWKMSSQGVTGGGIVRNVQSPIITSLVIRISKPMQCSEQGWIGKMLKTITDCKNGSLWFSWHTNITLETCHWSFASSPRFSDYFTIWHLWWYLWLSLGRPMTEELTGGNRRRYCQ